MPSEVKPRPRARPSLWALRTAVSPTAGRLASAASLGVLVAAWCVLSYVQVTRDGQQVPLVPHFFLPAPDQVVKSLFYLVFEKELLQAVGISGLRIVKAFGLSLAVALPLGIAMGI